MQASKKCDAAAHVKPGKPAAGGSRDSLHGPAAHVFITNSSKKSSTMPPMQPMPARNGNQSLPCGKALAAPEQVQGIDACPHVTEQGRAGQSGGSQLQVAGKLAAGSRLQRPTAAATGTFRLS
jgi:hypothetical protein